MSITVIIFLILISQIAKAFIYYEHMKYAQEAGVKAAQYNSAVASLINDLDPAVPAGTYTGISWLQGPTCAGGTGMKTYLACGFDPYMPFGYTFSTVITSSATANGTLYSAVTTLGAPDGGSGIDRPVGGATVAAAQAFLGIPAQNAEKNVGYLSYAMDANSGIVTATVDTSVSGVPWLNRNGSNSMTGNLNMGGNSIVNANNATLTGTLAANEVTATDAVTGGNSVHTPILYATNVNVSQTVSAGGNVDAGGTVNGGAVQSQTIVSAGTDIIAQHNVEANASGQGGDVTLLNTIVGGTNGTPPRPVSLAATPQGTTYIDMSSPYVNKPTCPQNLTPKVYSTPTDVSVDGMAYPIAAIQINYLDIGWSWQIVIQLFTAYNQQWQTAYTSNVRAIVMTTCE